MKKILLIEILTFTFFSQFLSSQVITTLAGGSGLGYVDGVGTVARFNRPTSIEVGFDSNIYVGDSNRIRKILPSGVVSTLAGSGQSSNLDGYGINASFWGVNSMRKGPGVLLVNIVRSVTYGGEVFTVSACNNCNARDFIYNGGNIVFTESNRIKVLNNGNSFASTLAGNPTNSSITGNADGIGFSASFNNLEGICSDNLGNYYVVDSGNHRIRKVTSNGEVTTVAGSTSGFLDSNATNAKFNTPRGICIDNQGNLYVADFYNFRIRKISTNGSVTTVANLSPYSPEKICIDSSGNLYVTGVTTFNSKIFKISDYNLNSSEIASFKNIKIFPNPANDHITIDCGDLSNVNGLSVVITNILGQEVYNKPIDAQLHIVQTSSWTIDGVYFVKISNSIDGVKLIKKIVLR